MFDTFLGTKASDFSIPSSSRLSTLELTDPTSIQAYIETQIGMSLFVVFLLPIIGL